MIRAPIAADRPLRGPAVSRRADVAGLSTPERP
jgi:hypothetical protein